MSLVRDDPLNPDPAFAKLYESLPDATDLWPWLDLAKAATGPVLYLGIGTGRIAMPLQAAGIDIVGVDSHPAMLDRLRERAPAMRLIQSPIETLDLDERFGLVMAPSNIVYLVDRLRAAGRHLSEEGTLAIELANPHWLRSGGGDGVHVLAFDANEARLDIDYRLPDGSTVTQRAEVALVWPEEVANWLAGGAGLKLRRMFGRPDAELATSPTFFVVAGR